MPDARRAAGQPRADGVRRHAAPGRPIPRRARADVRRRRLHVPEHPRSDSFADAKRGSLRSSIRSTLAIATPSCSRLNQPFGSFPINLVMPRSCRTAPATRSTGIRSARARTGSCGTCRRSHRADGLRRLLRRAAAQRRRGAEGRSRRHHARARTAQGRHRHRRQRSDARHRVPARSDPKLRIDRSPGADYQYLGFNLRDPILKDVRVRQALAYAIDRDAIIEYLRRGLAAPAIGLLPPIVLGIRPRRAACSTTTPTRARALLDEAGYPDPDGDGPAPRLRLTLKISTRRVQPAAGLGDPAEHLRAVGIDLDVRTYEFATLYADVLRGNFQMYSLQWVGGAAGRSRHPAARLSFEAGAAGRLQPRPLQRSARRSRCSTKPPGRPTRRSGASCSSRCSGCIAEQVPYISLWNKTNFIVAQRDRSGVHVSPIGGFHVPERCRATVE